MCIVLKKLCTVYGGVSRVRREIRVHAGDGYVSLCIVARTSEIHRHVPQRNTLRSTYFAPTSFACLAICLPSFFRADLESSSPAASVSGTPSSSNEP